MPPSPDAAHDAACERILLRACVLELAGPDRHVMELRAFHGWSPEEIAAYVGRAPSDVDLILARLAERTPHRRGEVLPDQVSVDVDALVADALAQPLATA